MQINANRDLYFPATPFRQNSFDACVLLKHYGLMNVEVRKRKYQNYRQQDSDGKKQGYQYDYLLDNERKLKKLDQLVLNNTP